MLWSTNKAAGDPRTSPQLTSDYSSPIFLSIYRSVQWHPTPVLLPGKSHGWRSLVGCSPWDREESDTTERLHFHFSVSRIEEGNGNPLQCSCPSSRDGGAWWAAVYGVAQSRTQLKQLSSSRSVQRMLVSLREHPRVYLCVWHTFVCS